MFHHHEKLTRCIEAVCVICDMEKKLYDENINLGEGLVDESSSEDQEAYVNKSIIQLESMLLDMASVPGLSKGILYIFPVTLNNMHILKQGSYLP